MPNLILLQKLGPQNGFMDFFLNLSTSKNTLSNEYQPIIYNKNVLQEVKFREYTVKPTTEEWNKHR